MRALNYASAVLFGLLCTAVSAEAGDIVRESQCGGHVGLVSDIRLANPKATCRSHILSRVTDKMVCDGFLNKGCTGTGIKYRADETRQILVYCAAEPHTLTISFRRVTLTVESVVSELTGSWRA